jgi:3beta-hydroxy-delta5-steroid dehydrogenase/steroid delta-isomerase
MRERLRADRGQLGRCLVTGAAGFLGRNLVKSLLERGCDVRALVHNAPLDLSDPGLQILKGDVRRAEDMLEACEGVDTVFHTAAIIGLLGGRAATREYRQKAYDANVEGTRNTLEAALKQGAKRFVYTSSVDVCFDGSPMPNMNEGLPYAARVKSIYAETKIAAESLVLEANERGGLLTCSIRPDGIYGAGDTNILGRFLDELTSGRLKLRIGNGSALQDNSHVDNLVHGEILAAEHLVRGGSACGKAYFITDNEPRNAFEFFRPLIEGLGYRFPSFGVPVGLLMPIVKLWQYLHFRFGIRTPVFTPHELDKIGVTHFASISAARQDLGYEPIKTVAEAMEECLAYCRELLSRRHPDAFTACR